MDQSPTVKQEQPSVPGIGVSGVVMCPHFKGPCLKGGCEMWVELNYGPQKVGRCSYAFQTIVAVELRQEIVKLNMVLSGANQKESKNAIIS